MSPQPKREQSDQPEERQTEQRDPTVRSEPTAEPAEGAGPAPPIEEADDAAVDKVYEDMPDEDKPAPSTVAQVEIRPEEREDR